MVPQSPIRAFIVLTIFTLITLSCSFVNRFIDQNYEAQPSARSSQESESGGDRPAITSLNLESFRSRLKEQEQDQVDLELPEATPVTTPRPDDLLVVANGTIIDGSGAAPISGGLVIIRGNRIAAIGPAADIAIPAKTKVIDVAGKTIMPGIINAHVHYSCDPAARRRFLVDGVTAVCDLGSSLRCLHNFEREYDWHEQPVARGFKAGPIITAPGGYPSTFPGVSWHYEVATPAEAEAAVDDLIGQGVDVIKIALEPGLPQQPWPVLSQKQVERIVSAAHARGLLVRAHLRQAAMLDVALEAGVDAIEHTPLPFCLEAELKQLLEKDALRLETFPDFEAQIVRMAQQGVFLTPTLETNTYIIDNLQGLTSEQRRQAHNFLFEVVGRFRAAGGVVVVGNDYGNPGTQSGMPVREMELLLAAGLSPMEVIEAGTRHAAYVSGYGNELGVLEVGKLADLIVVDGDPLTNIESLAKVVLVIKDGKIVYWVEQT